MIVLPVIENTRRGELYWTVSPREFVTAWLRPETCASIIPDKQHTGDVTLLGKRGQRPVAWQQSTSWLSARMTLRP
ncbi:MAG TPA: hypothetical protein VJG32_05500 [Anaerolineae bacterium]|nr:hypothetical protein [Anaerolineae bacterium]